VRTPTEIIDALALRIKQPQAQVTDINGVIRFDIVGEHSGSWLLQLNNARSVVDVSTGIAPSPADCTFRLSSPDFVNLFTGRVTGQQLFFDGRLEVDGDLTFTLKLSAITHLLRPSVKEVGGPNFE
jgi:ubiquinone biosynthesis protein UbiJ